MKKILLITLTMISALLYGQTGNHEIVACGGKFESGANPSDRATIGYLYDIGRGDYYQVFDTIDVESVQKVVVSKVYDGYIFLAAQDSIIQYKNTDNESFVTKKLNQISFPGIKTIAANENFLIAGKWYGTGDYLVVYDSETMNQLFKSETITTEINDIKIIQDTLAAVSYNLKGTEDACEPWGCYEDSVGRIDIIDLVNEKTIKTIDLGVVGKGSISLSTINNEMLISVSSKNKLISLFDQSFNLIADSVNSEFKKIISSNSSYDKIVGINGKDSVSVLSFNLENNEFILEAKNIASSGQKAIYTNNQLYTLSTDYDTFGKVNVNPNLPNEQRKFVNVGVSPEDIAIIKLENYIVGINSNVENTSLDLNRINDVQFDQLTIVDLKGVEVAFAQNNQEVNITNLAFGVYIATVEHDGAVKRIKAFK